MNSKLPYYMAYPMPLAYDDERMERRDYEYMKSLYPDTAKKVLPYVEEECDRNEYPCSMIYDEYPDRFMLYHICSQVKEEMSSDTIAQEMPGGFLDDLIEVLAYQEISRRRCRRRRCRQCRVL